MRRAQSPKRSHLDSNPQPVDHTTRALTIAPTGERQQKQNYDNNNNDYIINDCNDGDHAKSMIRVTMLITFISNNNDIKNRNNNDVHNNNIYDNDNNHHKIYFVFSIKVIYSSQNNIHYVFGIYFTTCA